MMDSERKKLAALVHVINEAPSEMLILLRGGGDTNNGLRITVQKREGYHGDTIEI